MFESGLGNRRQIAQILGKHLVSVGLRMRCVGATEELRLRPAGDTLQFVKQVAVGTTVSIREQAFGFAVFLALVGRIGEPGTDLHGAGLMLLIVRVVPVRSE